YTNLHSQIDVLLYMYYRQFYSVIHTSSHSYGYTEKDLITTLVDPIVHYLSIVQTNPNTLDPRTPLPLPDLQNFLTQLDLPNCLDHVVARCSLLGIGPIVVLVNSE